MGVSGALDYDINSWFSLRGLLGYDQFKSDADPYSTTISYITAMVWGRINIIQQETSAWIGAGFGIWYPMSKTSNAIVADSIDTTAAYALGGGVDIAFNNTFYIPVQLEYGFLPKSDQVKTSYYSVRAGFMIRY
jgi:hypothetical protein